MTNKWMFEGKKSLTVVMTVNSLLFFLTSILSKASKFTNLYRSDYSLNTDNAQDNLLFCQDV